MKEFEIYNEKTQKYNIMFGYNEKDAWERNPQFNKSEWEITYWEYID